MADIHLQVTTTADDKTAYAALTSPEGITGWWSRRADVPTAVGEVIRMTFPEAPMTWDLRIDELDEPHRVRWHCVGGPPQWIGTDVAWEVAPADGGGTVIRLDHTGFAEVDDMFRNVTYGWGQMLRHLQAYADTGRPAPYFTFAG